MIWANGEIVSSPQFLDQGFWFARGVFETIRVHSWPLFWAEHIQRLNKGIDLLGIRPPVEGDSLLRDVERLGIKDCVLKIAVTPDNIYFQTRCLPDKRDSQYRLWPVLDTRSTHPLLRQTKSLNYLEHLLAKEEAQNHGFDDALYVTRDGGLTETSRANVFWVADGSIQTPDLSCGLLDGTIRQWIVRTMPVETGPFSIHDLYAAEGVFVTNSVIGIQKVLAVGDRELPGCDLIDKIKNRYEADLTIEINGLID